MATVRDWRMHDGARQPDGPAYARRWVAARWVSVAAAAAVTLAACGGGGAAQETETAVASNAVTFDDAESATIKIEALGSFVSPSEGALEGDWWGSGFIIDPSGLAVTNNHVVVGAASLNVRVGGEERDAKILGTSECLDLAVIDLEGGGYPYFDWYDGDIKAALEVWALGFPDVGDREYAITAGIVSKPDTASDTSWASVDRAIEHDARIRGGNSGGPLITEAGAVVGVNYAGEDVNDLNLAIHRDEVLDVLVDLEKGIDVLSLGVNGSAFASDGGSGIFVSGVAPGSVADTTGLEPGDIITRMAGVTLTDPTMGQYCSILRTQGIDATLGVEVYRPSDGGTYAGQFNGDPLTVSYLPQTDEETTTAPATDLVTVTDDDGIVSVQVPASWSDVDGRNATDDFGNVIYDVTASPDIAAFRDTWTTPGVTVSASADALDDWTVDGILDLYSTAPMNAGCSIDGGTRQPYSDALYTGSYDYWVGCGGVNTDYVVIAATADDGSHLIWVSIQLPQGEGAALEAIVASFMASF